MPHPGAQDSEDSRPSSANSSLDMSQPDAQDSGYSGPPSPQYAYRPLQHTDEIRLLRIAPGTWEDAIRCDIFHCHLSQDISYEALSYTWGSEEKRFAIDCGESRWLATTSNCFDAIRRLRKPDRPRTLWIDAVCINQENALERGHQVRNMPRLYEEASQVIVYLGEADDDESRQALQDLQSYKWISGGRPQLTALKKLLQRPWFTRVWVLQEVYMARSLTVICGNVSLPWEPYFRMLKENPPRLFFGEELPHVLNLRVHDNSANRRCWDLFELLIDTGNCSCTDPRDRIFALLSMSSDESHQGIEADYESNIRDIYTRSAVRFLYSRGLDAVLAAVDNGPDTDELGIPSWVPDWRICQRCTSITKLVDLDPHDSPRALQILNKYILDVQGCCIGTIGDLGDVFEPKEFGWDKACITNWWQSFARAYPGAENENLEAILEMSFRRSHLFDFFLVEIRDLVASLVRSVSHAYFQNEMNPAQYVNSESNSAHVKSYKQAMREIMGALQKGIRRWRLHETYRKPIRTPMAYDFATDGVWRQVQAYNRDRNANRKAFLESVAHGDQKRKAMVSYALADLDHLMAALHTLGMVEACAQPIDANLLAWRFDNILQGFWDDFANEGRRFKASPGIDRQRILRCCRGRRLFTTHSLAGLVPANARQGDFICLLTAAKFPVLLRREDGNHHTLVGSCYINGLVRKKPEDLGEQRFLIR